MIKTLQTIDYHKEQIQTLLKSKFPAFGGNFIVPIIFFFIYKDIVPFYLLVSWLTAQIIVFITRIIIGNNILKKIDNLDKEDANKTFIYYLYAILTYSILWGVASIFVVLFADEIYTYVFFIIIMGIATAGMSTLSVVFHALFIFIFSIISILAISFILIGASSTYYLLALFALVYTIFILGAGFNSYIYMSNNITQKEELKKRNKNFENLLDVTMEAIIILDENHMIEDVNQSGLSLFNAKEKSQMIGQTLLKYLPSSTLAKLHQAMIEKKDEAYKLELKKDSSETFPALVSLKESNIDGRVVRIITILDLTKVKEKDRQLLQQSRLAQMGEMISMIAHQWRQPLAAISVTSSNLSLKVMLDDIDNDEFEKELALISDYSQHLSKTIDDFRGFFKEDKQMEITSLDSIVNSTLSITKISIENKNIKLVTTLDSKNEFETYPSELKQVLLNLIKNAEDILLENKTKNPQITIQTKDNTLIVKDNAGGVPKDIIDKIFDPYFSTKKEKDGTGLGLYMSKTIIEEHCNGELSVTNDDFGALFKIIIKV